MESLLNRKGFTLIELLIALVIGSVLMAGMYRTLLSQQQTYTAGSQVANMHQNARIAVEKMTREIRMAGSGNVNHLLSLPGGVNGFRNVITPGNNSITIVGAFKQARRNNGGAISVTAAGKDPSTGKDTLVLNYATDDFDGAKHHFISIGGLQCNIVASRSVNTLLLDQPLAAGIVVGTPVFKAQAITYSLDLNHLALQRDENTGGGAPDLAENIEQLEFRYVLKNETIPRFYNDPYLASHLADIRMILVRAVARTDGKDPHLSRVGDGYRRRELSSYVELRNL